MEFDVVAIVIPSEDFEEFIQSTPGIENWDLLAERVSENEAESLMVNLQVERV